MNFTVPDTHNLDFLVTNCVDDIKESDNECLEIFNT